MHFLENKKGVELSPSRRTIVGNQKLTPSKSKLKNLLQEMNTPLSVRKKRLPRQVKFEIVELRLNKQNHPHVHHVKCLITIGKTVVPFESVGVELIRSQNVALYRFGVHNTTYFTVPPEAKTIMSHIEVEMLRHHDEDKYGPIPEIDTPPVESGNENANATWVPVVSHQVKIGEAKIFINFCSEGFLDDDASDDGDAEPTPSPMPVRGGAAATTTTAPNTENHPSAKFLLDSAVKTPGGVDKSYLSEGFFDDDASMDSDAAATATPSPFALASKQPYYRRPKQSSMITPITSTKKTYPIHTADISTLTTPASVGSNLPSAASASANAQKKGKDEKLHGAGIPLGSSAPIPTSAATAIDTAVGDSSTNMTTTSDSSIYSESPATTIVTPSSKGKAKSLPRNNFSFSDIQVSPGGSPSSSSGSTSMQHPGKKRTAPPVSSSTSCFSCMNISMAAIFIMLVTYKLILEGPAGPANALQVYSGGGETYSFAGDNFSFISSQYHFVLHVVERTLGWVDSVAETDTYTYTAETGPADIFTTGVSLNDILGDTGDGTTTHLKEGHEVGTVSSSTEDAGEHHHQQQQEQGDRSARVTVSEYPGEGEPLQRRGQVNPPQEEEKKAVSSSIEEFSDDTEKKPTTKIIGSDTPTATAAFAESFKPESDPERKCASGNTNTTTSNYTVSSCSSADVVASKPSGGPSSLVSAVQSNILVIGAEGGEVQLKDSVTGNCFRWLWGPIGGHGVFRPCSQKSWWTLTPAGGDPDSGGGGGDTMTTLSSSSSGTHKHVPMGGLQIKRRSDGLCLCQRDCHMRSLSLSSATTIEQRNDNKTSSESTHVEDDDDRSWALTLTKCHKCGKNGACAGGWALEENGQLTRSHRTHYYPYAAGGTSGGNGGGTGTGRNSEEEGEEGNHPSSDSGATATSSGTSVVTTACLARRDGFLFNEPVAEMRPCQQPRHPRHEVSIVATTQVSRAVEYTVKRRSTDDDNDNLRRGSSSDSNGSSSESSGAVVAREGSSSMGERVVQVHQLTTKDFRAIQSMREMV